MRNKPVVWHFDFLYIYLGSTFVVNPTFKFFLQAHIHHSRKLSMYRVSCQCTGYLVNVQGILSYGQGFF